MKIGVNLIQYTNISGIEVFSKNLLLELTKQGSEHNFIFFVNEKSAEMFNIQGENIKMVVKKFKKISKLKLICYQQFGLIFKLKKEKVDLLYCPSLAVPIFYKKKIVTIHDCASLRFKDETGFISKIYLKLSFWSAKNLSLRIVTVSEFAKREIINLLKIKSDKIIVISEGCPVLPNIADNIRQSILNKFNLTDKKYFFYIGNSRPRKNIKNLLKAWVNFYSKNKNYYLVMAGKIYNSKIMDKMKVISENNNINFLGIVSDEEKAVLYKSSMALIFPSLYEGFGLPVLEAQSLGILVITSNSSSLPEIAGLGAILVNPEDYKDISAGLENSINPYFDRVGIIEKAYENLKRFSWSKTALVLLEIIKKYDN